MSASSKQPLRLGLLLMAAVLAAPSARAQLISYVLVKSADYTQTSTADPTTPANFSALAEVFGLPGDFTSASVTGGASTLVLTTGPSGGAAGLQSFSSLGALDTAFPNATTFTFSLSGGAYGGQSATLTSFGSNLFPSSAAYLTGSSFTHLQGAVAADAISLQFTPGVSLFINNSAGMTVWQDTTLSSSATSVVIPSNTLQAGQSYTLLLDELPVGLVYSGFSPAVRGFFAQGDVTVVSFSTAAASSVPEIDASSAYAAITLLLGTLAVLRRRIV